MYIYMFINVFTQSVRAVIKLPLKPQGSYAPSLQTNFKFYTHCCK